MGVEGCPVLATHLGGSLAFASRKCLGLRRLTAPETACVFCVLFPPPPTACSWLDCVGPAVALTLVLRFVRSTNGKQTDDVGP